MAFATAQSFVAGALIAIAALLIIDRSGNLFGGDDEVDADEENGFSESRLPVRERQQSVADSVSDSAVAVRNERLIQELIERIDIAEFRIESLEERLAAIDTDTAITQQAAPTSVVPPEQQLLAAGFDPFIVREVERVRDEVQLQRLELRDKATREGWIDSDRFRDQLVELRADYRLKQTLGDVAFDQLLVAEGRNNRVRIDAVIAGSAADIAGVEAGDIVFRYANDRIFTFGDLRRSTAAGERDEPVRVEIIRNTEPIELVVPRGPLGVTITGVTVAADE